MEYLLLVFSMFASFTLSAQTIDIGTTIRAVVIGISDYREPLIPDLRFADRDAEAFANWLRSPQGLALPDSSIRLLINQQATTAQMIVNLDWLIEASKPGDRAFIYFSGHGDVERVSKFQRGYLLGYDSPPAVYGAGAFSLNYLQDILSTLSENDVQVFIITDACRAGKLAGNGVSGTQVTAKQLSQQFANEVKVLSCQPDEFSLEGGQWGGGRGCFSYHLEDALYGFADDNHDASVDLLELRRYLEDHVSAEAAPLSQVPMVSGPVKTKIATVREGEVATRKAAKGNQPVAFRAIENKGMESRLLEKMDTSGQRLYAQFLAAIDSGHLMSPLGKSANHYFKVLVENPEMAALQGTMKRKLAAALMDEGQTILNKILQTDPQVLDNIWANRVHYDHLPAYFERAAEILGEKHYVWRDLKAKEYYFRAMTIREDKYPDSSFNWRIIEKRRLLENALGWDSTAAVAYYEMGNTFPYLTAERISFYKKASEAAPGWALIQHELGFNTTDARYAMHYFKKAIVLDSNYLTPYNSMSFAYDILPDVDSAIIWRELYVKKFLQKMNTDPLSVKAFECNDVGNAFCFLREYEKAKEYLLLGEKIAEGKMFWTYENLGAVYAELLDFENAVQACRKATPQSIAFNNLIGDLYFYYLNDPVNALVAYQMGGTKWSYGKVNSYALSGALGKAFDSAKQVIEKGPRRDQITFLYEAAEIARKMEMPDTANYFYHQIIEKAKIDFLRTYYLPLDYLFVAIAYSRLGMESEFHQLLDTAKEKLKNDPWLYFDLTCIYAQSGQEEAAIKSLQKAIELGWQPYLLLSLTGTLCDPMLNPIRETDAFKALVRQHFPKYYDIATRVPGRR
ncbi:MAG: caspase family protein [Saprospiraceae bacterium]|nr:caspase family protein [Saprospiraceae bacterium]MCF8251536.1 caspase family protein [Saprospiraceae bacterium]MCF8280866.1 caspase family protein [Bacteroidales bacterium]MCF8310954.1 caspase family protein [Saprospiraceae bacterium]MCF8439710.1 caspase family protein [Saprospiraceae bacterium]